MEISRASACLDRCRVACEAGAIVTVPQDSERIIRNARSQSCRGLVIGHLARQRIGVECGRDERQPGRHHLNLHVEILLTVNTLEAEGLHLRHASGAGAGNLAEIEAVMLVWPRN
jgi:hypothetical protein